MGSGAFFIARSKKAPDPISGARRQVVLGLRDVPGLGSLWTVNNLELDGLSLLQRPEAGALDGGVMDEDVAAAFAFDEPITLGVVEPLDLACDTHRSFSLPYVRREGREFKKKDRNGRSSVDGAILASAAEMIITIPSYV